MLSFPFPGSKKNDESTAAELAAKASKEPVAHPLDALTGGAFSAPTSGERAARLRVWLASNPSTTQMQDVFKELSVRDKGAAKPLRERLDEIKRAAAQDHIAQEWDDRAQMLLGAAKLNIADALAWQRDAAKAGAPLSKEPLLGVRTRLHARVEHIEDLQHRAQVQREAAMLLAQRVELLSTRSLADAQASFETLHVDMQHWAAQTLRLQADSEWPSVDPKFSPQLESARTQLTTLWDAFSAALAQATAAVDDAKAPLPKVPVWADAIRAARGHTVEKNADPVVQAQVDPAKRSAAAAAVREALGKLEQELTQGHGKASAQAANGLRAALKEHGSLLDGRLEGRSRDALSAAGEMEGWQKWRANQIRDELIVRAQALAAQPLSGRKQQEALRGLREAWKQTDQGGLPNHVLWRKFDEACNEAHKTVEVWIDKVKAEEAAHQAQRMGVIEEIQQWSVRNAARTDWKQVDRELHQLAERWRSSGHVGEKAFSALQSQYKDAMKAAHAPLESAQATSLQRRHALIEQAKDLAASPHLRTDAVKALQAQWQAEAQSVPLERKEEQKLWDAFRKPIDEAFARKGKAREAQAVALSQHDQAVIQASQELDVAIAAQDAKHIRAALEALELVARGASPSVAIQSNAGSSAAPPAAESAPPAAEPEPSASIASGDEPAPIPAAAPKAVVARRGDDRPGARLAATPKPEPVRFADRRGDRRSPEPRGPRLSNTAHYALRDGTEKAQAALRKLAAQAHGESVLALLSAWQTRSVDQVPGAAQLGRSVSGAVRVQWLQSLGKAATGDASVALLRLEMAAEVPTPAEHLDARRALQLELLTQRGQATPQQTWAQDVASVLASEHEQSQARRLQNVLKVLVR